MNDIIREKKRGGYRYYYILLILIYIQDRGLNKNDRKLDISKFENS
jgi:hypothetical protein